MLINERPVIQIFNVNISNTHLDRWQEEPLEMLTFESEV